MTNEVLAAPTSFFALASLRQAVRLACFAAASPEEAGAGVGGGFAADVVPANPGAIVNKPRHTAARVKDRVLMA